MSVAEGSEYRGRLLREESGPDALFDVSDGSRFVLVPSAQVDARSVGRRVAVRKESNGHVRVQMAPSERGDRARHCAVTSARA